MHPAPSIILFTVLSGLGFGTLFWLGLGLPDVTGAPAFGWYFLGYALAVGGLLLSVAHLAKPANSVKAFSQWRSSWLSREAVLAVIALTLVALAALGRIFAGGAPIWLSVPGALLCLCTVFATSMIYTQLRTIPAWSTPLTPLLFLAYCLAGGAVLTGLGGWSAGLLVLAGIGQMLAWHQADGAMQAAGTSTGTATGLGTQGQVRPFEPPHQGANYLLKEMAFRVGRGHRDRLRWIGLGLGLALPALLLLVGSGTAVWIAAAASHLVGVLAIRWLFFADARHVMSLYYAR